MRLIRETPFLRAYKKLAGAQRPLVDSALLRFQTNPFDARLRNHKLQGTLEGIRSIDAAHDLRILFREHDGRYEIVYLLAVGTHKKLYGGK